MKRVNLFTVEMGHSLSRRKAESKILASYRIQDPPTPSPPTPSPPTPREVEESFFSSIDKVLDQKKKEEAQVMQQFMGKFGKELLSILSFLQNPNYKPYPQDSSTSPHFWSVAQYGCGKYYDGQLRFEKYLDVFCKSEVSKEQLGIMIFYRFDNFKDELKKEMERKAREILPEFCEVKGLTKRVKISVNPKAKKVIFEPY